MKSIVTTSVLIVALLLSTLVVAAEIRYMCKVRGKTTISSQPCPKQPNPADYLSPAQVHLIAEQNRESRRIYKERKLAAEAMAAQVALNKRRERRVDDWDVPSPMISNRREPSGAIDVTTGTFMPKVAGGFIDPRNGTFHVDVGGGAINTRTGEFSPIIR